MRKLKITKVILAFVLVVTAISSIASKGRLDSGSVSTQGVEDWGWVIETR